jgi:hypothetical protein
MVITLLLGFVPFCADSVPASAAPDVECTSAQVTLSAISSHAVYVHGASVKVTIEWHNRAHVACSYATGPTLPNYTLTNSSGATVWGACWFAGSPAPCAFYLLEHILAPGATSRDVLTWNQRTGHRDRLVPAGRYLFRATMAGSAFRAATTFRIGGT